MSKSVTGLVKRGKQIKTLQELKDAAELKQCVVTSFNIMMPAGWVFQMQGQIIYEYMRRGLYIYKGVKKSEAL